MFRYLIVLVVLITSIYAKDGWVEATGYGNTKDEALKSAFSDAVSQYIGVMVDSKSLVKNGKLIEDKILTFSNGYIGNYKILNASQRAGLWQVKIKALVKEQKILNKIKQEKISIKNITNSKQRYAKLVSQIKTKFDAEDMFINKMKTLLSWDTMKKYNKLVISNFYIDEDGATREYVPVTLSIKQVLDYKVEEQIVKDISNFFKLIGGKIVYSSKTDQAESFGSLIYGLIKDGFSSTLSKIEKAKTVIYIQPNYWLFPKSYKVIYPFINQSWYYYENENGKFIDIAKDEIYKKFVINFLNKNGQIIFSIKDYGTKISNDMFQTTDDHRGNRHLEIEILSGSIKVYNDTINIPIKVIKQLSRIEVKWVD